MNMIVSEYFNSLNKVEEVGEEVQKALMVMIDKVTNQENSVSDAVEESHLEMAWNEHEIVVNHLNACLQSHLRNIKNFQKIQRTKENKEGGDPAGMFARLSGAIPIFTGVLDNLSVRLKLIMDQKAEYKTIIENLRSSFLNRLHKAQADLMLDVQNEQRCLIEKFIEDMDLRLGGMLTAVAQRISEDPIMAIQKIETILSAGGINCAYDMWSVLNEVKLDMSLDDEKVYSKQPALRLNLEHDLSMALLRTVKPIMQRFWDSYSQQRQKHKDQAHLYRIKLLQTHRRLLEGTLSFAAEDLKKVVKTQRASKVKGDDGPKTDVV